MTERLLQLVDPDLRDILSQLPNFDAISLATLADARAGLAVEPQPLDDDGDVAVTLVEVPGWAGGPAVPALLYRPRGEGSVLPALLHIHGGGYVAGDIWREHAAMLAACAEHRCVVLSIDYRLAPETPWPGPSDDCLAALTWLHQQAGPLNIDRQRIAVRGVSAGGGLATGLALRAAQADDLPIALLVLIYPMLDDRTGAAPHVGQHVWTANANRFGWSSYLGDVAGDPPPAAAPARIADVGVLPPTFMALGAIDLFAAENLAFASRLIAAGVQTELHVYPGAYHGFNLVPGARCAAALSRDTANALSRAFEETEK